jgi:hypothetical protein
MVEHLSDGARIVVDPNALLDARTSLLAVGSLLVDLRLGVARLSAESGRWAGDGLLPVALADLLATVDEAARRCQDDVVVVSDALWRGALDYQTVENALTVRRSTAAAGT